jgi:hypothetical protein
MFDPLWDRNKPLQIVVFLKQFGCSTETSLHWNFWPSDCFVRAIFWGESFEWPCCGKLAGTCSQGWEPILWKTIFDNDTDTQFFFYFRLSADIAEKNIVIAMNDDFAMKFFK